MADYIVNKANAVRAAGEITLLSNEAPGLVTSASKMMRGPIQVIGVAQPCDPKILSRPDVRWRADQVRAVVIRRRLPDALLIATARRGLGVQ